DDLTQAWLSTWSEGLAGLTTLEIQTGLQSSLNVEWPPSLPQFRNLCKPLPDYESLFNEACRECGKHAALRKWTSRMAYHAANVFGHFELKNATWSAAKSRWTKIIDELRAIGELDPIPEYHEKLPSPGRTTPDMQKINHYLAELHRIVGNQDRAKELEQ
ncbi:MAG: hypothetical protein KGI54_18825, partial [Pseudomonadota bacterium]|nr:hypothetical protein [Pseudomonadota bacterium]